MALTCTGLDHCEVPHLVDPQQLACPKCAGQGSTAQHASREKVPEVQTVTQVACRCTGVRNDICCTALPSMPAVRKHQSFRLSLRRSDGAHVGAATYAESTLRRTLPNKCLTGIQLLMSMIVYAVAADTSHEPASMRSSPKPDLPVP